MWPLDMGLSLGMSSSSTLSCCNSSYCVTLWFLDMYITLSPGHFSLHFYLQTIAKDLAHSQHSVSNVLNNCAPQ